MPNPDSTRQLILVHGRHFKPTEAPLLQNWLEALAVGLQRDHEPSAPRLEQLTADRRVAMGYYGDVSNEFLARRGKSYDEQQDLQDRKATLSELASLTTEQLESRKYYNKRPGKSRLREAVADALHWPLDRTGLANDVIGRVAPDIREYWNPDAGFGSDARWPLTELLRDSLRRRDEILLITHSLGSMIAHDVLWKLSHYGEYREISESGHKVSLWLTLGSPLGNPTVRKRLKGARAKGARRYPTLIHRWANVAAEDDYVAHDETLGDDFSAMKDLGLITEVEDHRIFNMALRRTKRGRRRSNPHHGAGYLVSPCVADLVATWLGDNGGEAVMGTA